MAVVDAGRPQNFGEAVRESLGLPAKPPAAVRPPAQAPPAKKMRLENRRCWFCNRKGHLQNTCEDFFAHIASLTANPQPNPMPWPEYPPADPWLVGEGPPAEYAEFNFPPPTLPPPSFYPPPMLPGPYPMPAPPMFPSPYPAPAPAVIIYNNTPPQPPAYPPLMYPYA